MTKTELVKTAAEAAGVTQADAGKVLDAITDAIIDAVKAGDKVTLVGFGTFEPVTRAARKGRNPATGKEIDIAAKTSGKFSPGKRLKEL